MRRATSLLLPLTATLALSAACGDEDGSDPQRDDRRPDDDGEVLCPDRSGGALVTLEACGTPFSLWITDDAFIDGAIDRAGQGPGDVPTFRLERGAGCDPTFRWHVDPASAEWADLTIEVCDGCPSFVEEEIDYWIDEVRRYCPWDASVIRVDDRR